MYSIFHCREVNGHRGRSAGSPPLGGADLHHQVVGASALLSAHSAAIEFGEQRVGEILRSNLAVKYALVYGAAYLD